MVARRGVGAAPGVEGLVAGLAAAVAVADERAEQGVDPVEHGRHRAEVGGQPLARAVAVAEVGPGRQEQLDVGPPEPVDRLLRVAHEEQPAVVDVELVPAPGLGAPDGGRDQAGQLDLERVGVLELVEQDVGVALVQGVAGLGAATQHLAGQHEQVVELEAAVAPAVVGGGQHLGGDAGQQVAQHLVGGGGHGGGHGLVGRLDQVSRRRHVVPAALAAAAAHLPRPGPEGAQLAQLGQRVVEGQDGPQPRLDPLDHRRAQRVVGIAAPVGQALEGGQGGRHRCQVDRAQRPQPGRGHGPEPIPALVQLDGDVLEGGLALVAGLEGDVEHGGAHEEVLVGRVVVEGVDEAGPPLLVGQLGRHLVEHVHARRQAGGHGELVEQPAGEAVQGGDGGQVGLGDGPAAPGGGLVVAGLVGALGLDLEPHPDAGAQLGGGRLGEGDGGHVVEPHAVVEHQVGDPLHQGGGLARAGTGLDEQGAAQPVAGHEVAGGLVGGLGHRSPSSSSDQARGERATSSGAPALASACSPRSRGHTASNVQ